MQHNFSSCLYIIPKENTFKSLAEIFKIPERLKAEMPKILHKGCIHSCYYIENFETASPHFYTLILHTFR